MKEQIDYIETNLKKVGDRLRELRKAKGYSNYEQFCFQHGFARSSYSRFERGEDLRFSSLLKVLLALEVSVEEFFAQGFGEEMRKEDIS